MGGRKQFVPWTRGDGSTVPLVAAAFDAIAPACSSMLVVVGHLGGEVIDVLHPRVFESVEADPDQPMSESLRAALGRILAMKDPPAGVMLHTCDAPRVARSTLDLLVAASGEGHVVLPTYKGRGGHPVLVPFAALASIHADPLAEGLRGYWHDHPKSCRRVPVDDDGIVLGLNTPEDLNRADR